MRLERTSLRPRVAVPSQSVICYLLLRNSPITTSTMYLVRSRSSLLCTTLVTPLHQRERV